MPGDADLYVLSGDDGRGDEDDETGDWVSPRPVDEAVVDLVTGTGDLSTDDLDDLDAYVDRADLRSYLEGEPAEDPLTFTVEGHDVVVTPDGTVGVDPE